MSAMPIGYITTTLTVGFVALLALRPPLPKHPSPWNLRFGLTYLINEQPFLGLYWLAAGTVPPLLAAEVRGSIAWLAAPMLAVPAIALVLLAARAARARPALDAALRAGLGANAAEQRDGRRVRLPLARILLLPFIAYRFDVRRVRNIRYGPARRAHRLDLYAGHSRSRPAPVMIYLHGGGFRMGNKMIGARPLLYRLASRGWVCISANYRLRPGPRYVDQLADANRVLAWVREHGASYGADPSTIVLAGGSSGAHLATMAALTGDTSIAGVVAMYGYYGPADSRDPGRSSPMRALGPQAPPFLIIHGALDTLALARDARHFATELRRVSHQPVVYAELPGAQHNFDLLHSLRFHAVCQAIEDFTIWVRARTRSAGAPIET